MLSKTILLHVSRNIGIMCLELQIFPVAPHTALVSFILLGSSSGHEGRGMWPTEVTDSLTVLTSNTSHIRLGSTMENAGGSGFVMVMNWVKTVPMGYTGDVSGL